jgi:hypothetical protein
VLQTGCQALVKTEVSYCGCWWRWAIVPIEGLNFRWTSMIDALNGTVSFGSWSLGPGGDEADFASATADHAKRKQRSVGVYVHHTLPAVTLANTVFTAKFTFKAGRIESISFSIPSAGTSWDDWSEAGEQQRKRDHDDWLTTQLGTGPYEYSWGVVCSKYYPQSGFSSITVRYC